ncbi:MAG: terpene cyclase/mutase family protein [Anaerolineaceae bacterium]|nr:terpene cyclase/mutase family protein [Anaerolineaceae bacterium]
MNMRLQSVLEYDPFPALLGKEKALDYHIDKDFIHDSGAEPHTLWELPEAARLSRKQLADGSWKYSGKSIDPQYGTNYFLLETFRNIRVLIEVYAFNHENETLIKACQFLLSCQSQAGDIRGILGSQYMPYYFGVMLELLIKAGYANDERIVRGLEWLISMRQEDGGWIVPAQAVPSRERLPQFWTGKPVEPERRAMPHAHLATGMALRGLAFHPDYCLRPETLRAARALKSRFFKADKFNDRKAKAYWLKFQFPFWWSNLLTALDTLGQLGFKRDDPEIEKGLNWFIENQEQDGLWPTGYGSGQGEKIAAARRWTGLAICRMLKKYFSND